MRATLQVRLATGLCLALLVAAGGGAVRAADPVLESPVAAPAEQPGMRPIFNGRDLSGWSGDERMWRVVDGVIRGETTAEIPAKGNTFLVWQEGRTKDFELRLSFRCSADNNSGIQYRSRHVTEGTPANPWVVRGYQHELRNERTLPNVAGFIYDEGGKRGRICLVGERAHWTDAGKVVDALLVDQEDFAKLFRLDAFNDVVIRAEGDRIRHWLNDRLILDFTDAPELALRDGVLALQLHAGKPMWAEFRDVRIREIE
jgi:hypothetical protein